MVVVVSKTICCKKSLCSNKIDPNLFGLGCYMILPKSVTKNIFTIQLQTPRKISIAEGIVNEYLSLLNIETSPHNSMGNFAYFYSTVNLYFRSGFHDMFVVELTLTPCMKQ